MESEWNESIISDLLAKKVLWIEDGNHGENRPRQDEFTKVGVPFIRPDDLKAGRVDFRNCDHINQVGYARVRKGKGQSGDILFTHRATVGRMARVGSHDPKFVANPGVTVWRVLDPGTIDPSFLYFAMQGSHFMDQVWAEAGNTDTFPYVSLTQQRRLILRYPEIETQREIARALGALDDKIALLRDTNATLEALAQALFKSWFVDFDPVRAKADGQDPEGVPPEMADLFPSEFQDSELGAIPKGWGVGTLSDIFEIQGGTQPPASEFLEHPKDGYVRLLQIRDFSTDAHKTYIPKTKKLRLVEVDDVLIGRYGSGSGDAKKDSLGRLLRGLSGAINVAVVKTIPKIQNSKEYIAALVGSGMFYRFVVGGSARAVQAGFRQEDLEFHKVVIPPGWVFEAFEELASAIWERRKMIWGEAESLGAIRNTLLPRLMSGKLRFPTPEEISA